MRVRMLTLMAGPEGIRSPGSVVDVPQADAVALIDGGFAESAEPAAKVVSPAPVVSVLPVTVYVSEPDVVCVSPTLQSQPWPAPFEVHDAVAKPPPGTWGLWSAGPSCAKTAAWSWGTPPMTRMEADLPPFCWPAA